ncbi:MAG TPA: hypothetical protein VFZ74_14810 [Burkholderiales bacterium]
MSAEQPVLLGALLERQGEGVLRTAILTGGRAFHVALRACGRCPFCRRCQASLDSGARDGYQDFCPSAPFIEHTKRLVC